MKCILIVATLVSPLMAANLTVKAPLTEKSAYHLHEVFVQNSGAKVDGQPYKNYTAHVAHIPDIDQQDLGHVKKVLANWLKANSQQLKGLKLRVTRAEADSKKVFMICDSLGPDVNKLYYGLQNTLDEQAFPSGKQYHVTIDSRGRYSPSIYVGDIKGFTPKQVKRTINRRITQSDIIHDTPYFEVEADSVSLN